MFYKVERYAGMSLDWLGKAFENYGLLIIFGVVLLEYINFPGFPAGIILPFAGMWAQREEHFILPFLVTIAAGVFGSIILYYLGKFGGSRLLRICIGGSPKINAKVEALKEKIEKKGSYAVFISKLIPIVRTLVGIPAGALNMKFKKYLVASALGIVIWNGVLFSCGYWLGSGL